MLSGTCYAAPSGGLNSVLHWPLQFFLMLLMVLLCRGDWYWGVSLPITWLSMAVHHQSDCFHLSSQTYTRFHLLNSACSIPIQSYLLLQICKYKKVGWVMKKNVSDFRVQRLVSTRAMWRGRKTQTFASHFRPERNNTMQQVSCVFNFFFSIPNG